MKHFTGLVLILIYCVYDSYAAEQVEVPEEVENILKLFDEEQRALQPNVWFRRSHVCYNDSFYSTVGDKHNDEINEECDGTITWIMCNTTVLGYQRRRVHICCAGFEDVKGDKCKAIGTDTRDNSTGSPSDPQEGHEENEAEEEEEADTKGPLPKDIEKGSEDGKTKKRLDKLPTSEGAQYRHWQSQSQQTGNDTEESQSQVMGDEKSQRQQSPEDKTQSQQSPDGKKKLQSS